MRVRLLWFTFFLVALLIAGGVAVAMFSRQLRRQNRVDPDVESYAPLVWLWSPAQAARLHRRLRAAATAVYLPPPIPEGRSRRRRTQHTIDPTPTEELSRGLREQATALDEHLVRVARLPRPARRQQLRGLQPHVIEVERLATRLLQHQRRVTAVAEVPGGRPTQPTPPEALAAIAGQLDVLEQAHDELFAIERANGLLDPDAVMRQVTPPAYAPRPVLRSTRPPVGPPLGRPTMAPPPSGPLPPPVGPPLPGPPPPPPAGPRRSNPP
jgi:hypothetical protein